jgi:monovalent cation:H+ antiporter-2, CPA2 family
VHPEPWIKDVFVFLAAAGLIVPLFHRARIGAVLGFLVVGVVVGPYGFGQLADDYPWVRYLTIEDRGRVEPFAELGVMFLLFTLGLELSLSRLWSLRHYVLGIGGAQFVVSALAIGVAAALMNARPVGAFVLGLCLAMSSTALVMQLLEEQGRVATRVGRIALSILLFQDLMVAPVLMLTGAIGRDSGNVAPALALAAAQAVLAVVCILAVGRFVLRPLLGFTARTGSRDLIMAITVLIVVGVAGGTGLAGLSTALGAFLAGLLIGETEYRHHVEVDLEPFKGLLLGLFFITVGMSVDIRAVAAALGSVMAAVFALLAVKAVILFVVSRLFGVALAAAAELALVLSQAGEFGFVVVGLSRANDLISLELASFLIAVISLTMMVTPFLALAARRLARRLERVEQAHHALDLEHLEIDDHVVIGGFGRVGQTIARLLESESVPYVALDTDAAQVAEHRKAGLAVYFGDVARRELLERAGAKHARAFVITVNAPEAAERMAKAIVALRPDAPLFARAKDGAHAARLRALGSVEVVPEAVEASLQLGARVLEGLGLPDDVVVQRVSRAREEEFSRLAAPPAG